MEWLEFCGSEEFVSPIAASTGLRHHYKPYRGPGTPKCRVKADAEDADYSYLKQAPHLFRRVVEESPSPAARAAALVDPLEYPRIYSLVAVMAALEEGQQQKRPAKTNGKRSSTPAQRNSDHLDINARRRRWRMNRAEARDQRRVELVDKPSARSVRRAAGVRDQILDVAFRNAGLEVGGVLGGPEARSWSPTVITEASEPGPAARCAETWFQCDPDHDLRVIEEMRGRGLVELGSWHTHVVGATDRELLSRPSEADLARWSLLRSSASFIGLIVVMPVVRGAGTPTFHGWQLRASAIGDYDICEPVTLSG